MTAIFDNRPCLSDGGPHRQWRGQKHLLASVIGDGDGDPAPALRGIASDVDVRAGRQRDDEPGMRRDCNPVLVAPTEFGRMIWMGVQQAQHRQSAFARDGMNMVEVDLRDGKTP